MTASITAKDYSFDHGDVTISFGGSVSFGYPTGTSSHNVVFDTAQPTSCTNMPSAPAGPGWSGNCTFEMIDIRVPLRLARLHDGHSSRGGPERPHHGNDRPAPTETTGPTPPGGGEPIGGELTPPAVKVAARQRGVVVHGSVTTPAGPSDIAVTALAARSALASRARHVKVGSVSRRSTGTGKTSFSLRVNRAARRALHRRHRLALTLRIAVTADAGRAFKKTVTVVLREKT
jgi:hypothetical protein